MENKSKIIESAEELKKGIGPFEQRKKSCDASQQSF